MQTNWNNAQMFCRLYDAYAYNMEIFKQQKSNLITKSYVLVFDRQTCQGGVNSIPYLNKMELRKYIPKDNIYEFEIAILKWLPKSIIDVIMLVCVCVCIS